ncbi:hypothetical protein [Sphingomonas koreensis]|uniref:hypothetical protein n=1 Tax=Sphingomonas koreensis TaxID=93064 RepID=UPI0019D2E2B6|nr:hypothetical protein [Sphingomonas koreensis]
MPHERRLATRLDLLGVAVRAFAEDAPTLILIGDALRAEGEGARVRPEIPEVVHERS